MAKPIGQVIQDMQASETPETVSLRPATTPTLTLQEIRALRGRLDDQMLDQLRAVVEEPATSSVSPCEETHLTACLRTMATMLSRRSQDEGGGKLAHAVYHRMLGRYSREAINHLTEEVLKTCQWMPTVKECLDILSGWTPSPTDQQLRQIEATTKIRYEVTYRMEDALERLALEDVAQEYIDSLPEFWKRVASEKCLLWWHKDGSFTLRRKAKANG